MTKTDIFPLTNQNISELVFCRAKDCISTELDGETVILDIVTGLYSGLDSLGTFIWNQLEQSSTFPDLRDAILERYDVTKDQCGADLHIFLKDLLDNGLITIKDE